MYAVPVLIPTLLQWEAMIEDEIDLDVVAAEIRAADAWLTNRRDQLSDEAGLRSLIAEAAGLLFEPPPRAPLLQEEPEYPEIEPRPELFTGPVQRTRRR